MKKILCKTINEYDNGFFICIDDIISVGDHGLDIHIYLKGEQYPYKFSFDNDAHAKKFIDSLIKELEDYYKENHYEWDIELMDLVYTSAIKHKLNDMNEAGWELVDMLTEGVKELLVVHRKIKED